MATPFFFVVVRPSGDCVWAPVARRRKPVFTGYEKRLIQDGASDLGIRLALSAIIANEPLKFQLICGTVLFAEYLPGQRERQSLTTDEESTSGDVVQWTVELEEKRCAGFEVGKFPPARTPEIDFVRTDLLKKLKLLVVGYTNIEAHASGLRRHCSFLLMRPILRPMCCFLNRDDEGASAGNRDASKKPPLRRKERKAPRCPYSSPGDLAAQRLK